MPAHQETTLGVREGRDDGVPFEDLQLTFQGHFASGMIDGGERIISAYLTPSSAARGSWSFLEWCKEELHQVRSQRIYLVLL